MFRKNHSPTCLYSIVSSGHYDGNLSGRTLFYYLHEHYFIMYTREIYQEPTVTLEPKTLLNVIGLTILTE